MYIRVTKYQWNRIKIKPRMAWRNCVAAKLKLIKMHPVFIEFYHFLVEIILFTNNAN